MASKYVEASQETYDILKELITEHYSDINAVGVTFDLIMAFGARDEVGELTGPAIKVHGHPASGCASIVNLKNRAMGRKDGEIMLDGDVWDTMTPGQQKALIDHELFHFEIARNVDGEVIKDTANRPKLRMRQHDREFGWFDIIAARHGEDSAEVIQARQLFDEGAQVYFKFLGDKALKGVKPLKLLPKPKGAGGGGDAEPKKKGKKGKDKNEPETPPDPTENDSHSDREGLDGGAE